MIVKAVGLVAFLLVLGLGSAQIQDYGVAKEVDANQRTVVCSQSVVNPGTPDYLGLAAIHDAGAGILLLAIIRSLEEPVFGLSGAVEGDEVLFRMPNDDAMRFVVVDSAVEPVSASVVQETAFVVVSESFLRWLFGRTEDVDYRLHAVSGKRHEGSVAAEHLRVFSGFLEACL